MQKRRPTAIIQFLVVLLFVFSIPAATYGQTGAPPDPLQEGIREYQADNYEEAVELARLGKDRADGARIGLSMRLQGVDDRTFVDELRRLDCSHESLGNEREAGNPALVAP